MVQVDGRDDTDLPALLGVELLRDGLIGHRAGLIRVDHAGVGLVSGGDGSGGGSGVRGEGTGIVGDGGAGNFEVHEVQRHGAIQDSALTVLDTGLGLHVIRVSHSTQIVGSRLELGIAHAVADEQEHIPGCGNGFHFRLGGNCFDNRCSRCRGRRRALGTAAGQGAQHQARRQQNGHCSFHFGIPSIRFCRFWICVFHGAQFTRRM